MSTRQSSPWHVAKEHCWGCIKSAADVAIVVERLHEAEISIAQVEAIPSPSKPFLLIHPIDLNSSDAIRELCAAIEGALSPMAPFVPIVMGYHLNMRGTTESGVGIDIFTKLPPPAT